MTFDLNLDLKNEVLGEEKKFEKIRGSKMKICN